jgi:hypothetical protein
MKRAAPETSRRRNRPRPTPSWLKEQKDLDEVARRRCLLLLSVLSGELPVTDAIQQAGISRGLYYQLESKALRAMLQAMAPSAEAEGSTPLESLQRQVVELEAKVKKAEQEKRRVERLLFLTRKVVRPGPMKSGHRGRPKGRHSSTGSGPAPSTRSTASPPTSASTSPSPPSPSGTGGTSR